MIKNLVHTFGIRVISSASTFLLLILMTQFLGASGSGVIGLLMAAIFIVSLCNGYMGGSSLVYLVPQNKNASFVLTGLSVSYVWAVFSAVSVSWLLRTFGFFQAEYLIHVIILGFLCSISTTHAILLLSFKKILHYNITMLLQVIVGMFVFGFLIATSRHGSILKFLFALYIAYTAAACYSLLVLVGCIRLLPRSSPSASARSIVQKILKFGVISQSATTIQYLNYRIGLFMLNRYCPTEDIGIYLVGIRISEAIWMISSSIALVHYSYIANLEDERRRSALTVYLAKFSLIITALFTVVVVFLPESAIAFVFGREFPKVHQVSMTLAVGIVAMGFGTIVAHYFAGVGRYGVNLFASSLGFIATVIGNAIWLPSHGILATGLVSSFAYSGMTLFWLFMFLRATGLPFSTFLFRIQDVQQILGYLKQQGSLLMKP